MSHLECSSVQMLINRVASKILLLPSSPSVAPSCTSEFYSFFFWLLAQAMFSQDSCDLLVFRPGRVSSHIVRLLCSGFLHACHCGNLCYSTLKPFQRIISLPANSFVTPWRTVAETDCGPISETTPARFPTPRWTRIVLVLQGHWEWQEDRRADLQGLYRYSTAWLASM